MDSKLRRCDEWLAEIISKQITGWVNKCPLLKYLVAQQRKIERLEHYIKMIEDRWE